MQIFIDGSCRPSTRLGAYAILIIDDKGKKEVISGKQEDCTNNIMELKALAECLKHIKNKQLDKQYDIEIFSDSQYVVKGITEWWTKWQANGYKTSDGGDVKNLAIWKEINKLSKEVKCRLTWIKGHANNINHNEVDRIVFGLTSENNE